MTFAILCTGPSMSQAVADSVRHLCVVAVNNAFELAPWAEAMAANDVRWWNQNPHAQQFKGRKFSASSIHGVQKLPGVATSQCSGVVAMEVAKQLGAKRIVILGLDGQGSHYFGDYSGGLKNAQATHYMQHAAQFKKWGAMNQGIEVINATPNSAVKCFPFGVV